MNFRLVGIMVIVTRGAGESDFGIVGVVVEDGYVEYIVLSTYFSDEGEVSIPIKVYLDLEDELWKRTCSCVLSIVVTV